MKKLAIIGTGIAGMSAAYFLKDEYEVTLFEKNPYIGGHTHTVTFNGTAFDTGFMVFNFETYPLLKKLLEQINAPIMKTDMSFSVQNKRSGLEFCGSGISGLFSQKRNLFRPSYYKMLLEIDRFNKQAPSNLEKMPEMSISEYQKAHHHSEEFLENYLIPMAGAIWSTPFSKMLDFPAKTLIQFFKNHGLLGLDSHYQWYTIQGGSWQYRDKLIAGFKEKISVSSGVKSIQRLKNSAVITLVDHSKYEFDKVIIATHADEALTLLQSPTPEEKELLSPFKYQENMAYIHTDPTIMPEIPKNWSAWNFRYENNDSKEASTTTYWMNKLQSLKTDQQYFVTINPSQSIDQKKILKTIQYHHPLFDLNAITAQRDLFSLNHDGPLYFCGSYFRYGFHEDALLSSFNLASFLLDREVL